MTVTNYDKILKVYPNAQDIYAFNKIWLGALHRLLDNNYQLALVYFAFDEDSFKNFLMKNFDEIELLLRFQIIEPMSSCDIDEYEQYCEFDLDAIDLVMNLMQSILDDKYDEVKDVQVKQMEFDITTEFKNEESVFDKPLFFNSETKEFIYVSERGSHDGPFSPRNRRFLHVNVCKLFNLENIDGQIISAENLLTIQKEHGFVAIKGIYSNSFECIDAVNDDLIGFRLPTLEEF